MRKKLRNDSGFTMAELMVVVLIIGLMAILSMPAFGRFIQNWRLNGDAEQFAVTLRSARSSAVMKNIDVVFSFDMTNDNYSYFEDSDRNGNRSSDEFQSATYTLSPGVRIVGHTFSSSKLTFGSKGNTRESGTITLRNPANKNKTVRIFGGTGNITVD
ncbi:MAG: GspH/FimT family pseudopilin [Candidatus Krumholzibacteriota bacterium]|nr:GspH/FimT family pseudopilin [Candidatus Krumholzibacteriota bacterium]